MKTTSKKPTLSSSELQRVQTIYKTLPNGLKKVGMACEIAIDRLMGQGIEFVVAENMVLILLEESKIYLRQGMFASVIKSIEMCTSK